MRQEGWLLGAECDPAAGSPPSLHGATWNGSVLAPKLVLQEGQPGRGCQGGTDGRRWPWEGTLSPSSRNRSPERGAFDSQCRGDGFPHAPFPCLDPSPAAPRAMIHHLLQVLLSPRPPAEVLGEACTSNLSILCFLRKDKAEQVALF